jgi:hypothetical protein
LRVGLSTVHRTRQRFVEEGLIHPIIAVAAATLCMPVLTGNRERTREGPTPPGDARPPPAVAGPPDLVRSHPGVCSGYV